MDSGQSAYPHPPGEALSAFFVGLLYFIAQWMWQMQNSKQGVALPYAYALLLATSITGALSWHSLLMYASYPGVRMRIINALLFLPFTAIGVASFSPARKVITDADPSLITTWWFLDLGAVVLLAGLIAISNWLVARYLAKRERRDASPRPANEQSGR